MEKFYKVIIEYDLDSTNSLYKFTRIFDKTEEKIREDCILHSRGYMLCNRFPDEPTGVCYYGHEYVKNLTITDVKSEHSLKIVKYTRVFLQIKPKKYKKIEQKKFYKTDTWYEIEEWQTEFIEKEIEYKSNSINIEETKFNETSIVG